MTFSDAMNQIALADLSVEEARETLRTALSTPSPAIAGGIYHALRSWVWKTLDSRRRDPELRDWHQLAKGVVGILRYDFPSEAERIDTLADLIHEAVTVAEVYPVEAVTQRQHVKEILYLIYRNGELRMSRSELRIALGLKQGNLTRILNMMVMGTLLRRVPAGKEAFFELTPAGVEQASRVRRADLSPDLERGLERPNLRELFAAITERTNLDDYSAPRTRLPVHFIRHRSPRIAREPQLLDRVGGESAKALFRRSSSSESRTTHGKAIQAGR